MNMRRTALAVAMITAITIIMNMVPTATMIMCMTNIVAITVNNI